MSGKKNRSLGQILEKPCVCSGGYIFSPVLVKLGQNVYLSDILGKIVNKPFRVKPHFQSDTHETWS